MVEEKNGARDYNLRQALPWMELFRGFQVAMDFRKLLLAAAGILLMAFGWWLLAVIFYSSKAPEWPSEYKKVYADNPDRAWVEFKADRRKWNLLHQAAGPADSKVKEDAADLAASEREYNLIREEMRLIDEDVKAGKTIDQIEKQAAEGQRNTKEYKENDKVVAIPKEVTAKALSLRTDRFKPAGQLRTWPWFEDRGSNPYLLVTGQAGANYQTGHVWERVLGKDLPVLVEPLVKFLRPVIFFLHPDAGVLGKFYFFLVLLWTLAVWALFGGAITRMAAVEVARREKIGMVEAVRFAARRFLSFFTAPLFPLIFVGILGLLVILFGVIHLIPWVGDLWDGLLFPLVLVAGLVMAVVLVGLVGWPLMSATISAEGTDSWEAVSRSYSYVFQAPWHYVWYCLVAICYGAVLVFFVGFMGSLMVYLSKWALTQTPFVEKANREPSYLFVYAPTSYQWQELLLQGGKVGDTELVSDGKVNWTAYDRLTGRDEGYKGDDKMSFFNKVGAFLVSVWLYLLFLMILGFGYSYFWTASTIIYLLMRRKVDDAELDEVYLEEEDQDDFYKEPPKPADTTAPAPGSESVMVEAPSLRVAPPAPAAPPAEGGAAPPAEGDGNKPEAG